MGKSKTITLEDAKKLDNRIEKEYPDKKPVKLGEIVQKSTTAPVNTKPVKKTKKKK